MDDIKLHSKCIILEARGCDCFSFLNCKLADYVIISIKKHLFTANCCVLTQLWSGPENKKRRRRRCVTSLSTPKVMTLLVLYTAELVLPKLNNMNFVYRSFKVTTWAFKISNQSFYCMPGLDVICRSEHTRLRVLLILISKGFTVFRRFTGVLPPPSPLTSPHDASVPARDLKSSLQLHSQLGSPP